MNKAQKIAKAAKLLEEAGMPYVARMVRDGGTAADQLLAGTLIRCPYDHLVKPGDPCAVCIYRGNI